MSLFNRRGGYRPPPSPHPHLSTLLSAVKKLFNYYFNIYTSKHSDHLDLCHCQKPHHMYKGWSHTHVYLLYWHPQPGSKFDWGHFGPWSHRYKRALTLDYQPWGGKVWVELKDRTYLDFDLSSANRRLDCLNISNITAWRRYHYSRYIIIYYVTIPYHQQWSTIVQTLGVESMCLALNIVAR